MSLHQSHNLTQDYPLYPYIRYFFKIHLSTSFHLSLGRSISTYYVITFLISSYSLQLYYVAEALRSLNIIITVFLRICTYFVLSISTPLYPAQVLWDCSSYTIPCKLGFLNSIYYIVLYFNLLSNYFIFSLFQPRSSICFSPNILSIGINLLSSHLSSGKIS